MEVVGFYRPTVKGDKDQSVSFQQIGTILKQSMIDKGLGRVGSEASKTKEPTKNNYGKKSGSSAPTGGKRVDEFEVPF